MKDLKWAVVFLSALVLVIGGAGFVMAAAVLWGTGWTPVCLVVGLGLFASAVCGLNTAEGL